MKLIRLIYSFFKKWVSSVYQSNFYEGLVILEAPSKSHKTTKEEIKQSEPCCDS